MLHDNAVTIAEKELARTGWEVEQCLAYLYSGHRLQLLKILADGRHAFNNGFARMAKDRKWITSLQMADGFWEACKDMLYGLMPDGKPWANDLVKQWAWAELDTYDKPGKTTHHYEDWHRSLGSMLES